MKEGSIDAAELEEQLDRIFQTAKAWDALLLLDEADVFLQERSRLSLDRNRLVAVFLRKVEFFEGVSFLTTNLLNDFDAAILNRIHLKLKYDDLDESARKALITQFLKPIHEDLESSNISTEYIDRIFILPQIPSGTPTPQGRDGSYFYTSSNTPRDSNSPEPWQKLFLFFPEFP